MSQSIRFSCYRNRFDENLWQWHCVVELGEHHCFSHGEGFPTLTGVGSSKDEARQDAKRALLAMKSDMDRVLEIIDIVT